MPLRIPLITLLFLSLTMFAEAQVKVDPKTDPTSQSTWSGGNTSGQGTFMSLCTSCHGNEGKGNGTLADMLDVKPRDLSDVEFMTSVPDEHLFKVIKDGGASVGLTENMTPFNEQMSDEEIINVIAYLRSDICKCTFAK